MKDLKVVDLVLKNNKGTLTDGVVFYNDTKDMGNLSVQNEDEIVKVLRGEFNDGWVIFQNTCVHAKIGAKNIESYIIKEIKNDKF
jgi:hypothetical protein